MFYFPRPVGFSLYIDPFFSGHLVEPGKMQNLIKFRYISGLVLYLCLMLSFSVNAESKPVMEVFQSPTCGCCKQWNRHMEENGFIIQQKNIYEIESIKSLAGIPLHLRACHTAVVDGYVIEGHVPPRHVKKLLKEKADIVGITVPNMMSNIEESTYEHDHNYTVMTIENDATSRIYSDH